MNNSKFLDRTTPPHIVTLVVISGLSALNMNLFLPSLPGIATHYHADYALVQLAVSGYLGFTAILQLLIGPLSDRYGRRPVMLVSLVIFLVATALIPLAPTVESFLVIRMLQASVVSGLVLSRAIIRDVVDTDQAASMIGYVTMGMTIAPMIGPALGGVLDELFGWQANFWILILLGGLTLWLVWADLGETKQNTGQTLGQQIREYPELFLSPRFWGYCASNAFSSGAFFAYLGGAPYVGSEIFGLEPAELGIYFGAPAVGYFLGNFLSGRYSVRFGVNRMVFWGSVILLVSMAGSLLLFLVGLGSAISFFGLMAFVGLGNGMTIPNATAGMLSVRPHLAGSASGLGGAIMIGGGAALSALAGAMLAPGTGAYPLLIIMLLTSVASMAAIMFVIWRQNRIGATTL